ncbi:ABC transporter [Xylaria bambusicola]|uniref:ABC transporter n=1 Tax=Xylaria bambusicola TaxID=326684 RepID=UPI002008735E|nr:ABC transporter [Xylaria bambusicola]KAI0514816.1 ABC transporter [Xylaria bambusicola]
MDVAHRCSIAQAAAAGACLILYFICIILPRAPQWARPFAQEAPQYQRHPKSWTSWSISLFALSILGLVSSSLLTISPSFNYFKLLDTGPWVAGLLITLVGRPKRTPKALLALYVFSLVCGLIALASTLDEIHQIHILRVVTLGIELTTLVVILLMPMRDPSLESAGIAGTREPPTSELRSPEDNLSLLQFMTISWLSPLISRGYNNQLNDEDVWFLPYEFQHKQLHILFRELKGPVWLRLMLANGLDLFIISALGILEATANLAAPLLLQSLLISIEKGLKYRTESMFWAFVMLTLRLISAQSGVFSLWFGRRAYERSRGEMITMVYAKTLARKSYGQPLENGEHAHENSNENGNSSGNGDIDEETPLLGRQLKPSRFKRLFGFFKRQKVDKPENTKRPPDQPATMGKILNLMKSDVYEVAQRFWDFAGLITTPLQLALSLVFLWHLLGWSCLLGLAWFIIVQLLNASCIRRLYVNEKLRRSASDVRINATSQFIEAIRPLRWYDWQYKWLDTIMKSRTAELHLRIITGLWNIAISATNLSGSSLFPVFTFFAYTYIEKKPLTVDIAFPALQLFSMLETSLREIPNLVTVLLNAYVSLGRIEAFMAEPDKEEGDYDNSLSDIEFQDATFVWPTNQKTVLKNLNLRFTPGLSIICGRVGAGKTALLQAILGELDRVNGGSILPNEMVGYCAQSPWLQNMSIRDNILFNFPYDPIRYKKVVDACALTLDLASFSHGDLSNIGENGIGLSGGQKARVALARAVYSNSRILLLDDPLAALDHNTAESIVRKLFQGSLMEGRIILLVTHRVDLCAHLADQFVQIDKGHARVLEADEISQEITMITREQEALADSHSGDEVHALTEEDDDAALPDKFITDEHRASGGVVARIYWIYIKAGKLRWWLVAIALFALFRLARIFNAWFLKAWGEGYSTVEELTFTTSGLGDGIFNNLPSPIANVTPWLMGYAALGVATTILFTITQGVLLLILYLAAKDLFGRVLHRVSSATFRFYDTTPVGRLMNRLTSDIGMLDGGMIAPLQDVTFWSINWIISMVVIASITPMFFVFALAMTLLFTYIFNLFIPTSQSLRRLEMVSLSPLMSNFGILLEGLATIRAFKAQAHFQAKNIAITDAFQKMDHFYWSLQAWLQYRFDAISAVSTFSLVLLSLYQGLSPGLTAFVLATASQFVDATHGICKAYGKLQMDFVSVERVVELLDLEEEPVGHLKPPASWPSYSDDIAFDQVTLKYAPHLDPSLQDVTFIIPGGATCAVLGRTGSGKSTLALSLLATMHPERGRIRVGSVDISQVDVHTWRQRISFVAQDPVLFPGTLRDNLDPLDLHSDDECEEALHRILGPGWTLDSRVEDGGKNLSQGQRQLVGIGRAVLRRSPIIILDEATASIDKETALAIQDVLRDELAQSTVITIAHRLEAVRDADYFIRLDAGRVVEAGPASQSVP